MSKGIYKSVNNVARQVTSQYKGVDNIAREIKKAWKGVGNVARLYFQKTPYKFEFTESNIDSSTNEYFHGFEDGAIKLYLKTNLTTDKEPGHLRTILSAKVYCGENLGGKIMEFTHKRYPVHGTYIYSDSFIRFMDANGSAITWDTTVLGNNYGHRYGDDKDGFLLDTQYTTKTITIPDNTMYVAFFINNGANGTCEQTLWINHLSIDGIDII